MGNLRNLHANGTPATANAREPNNQRPRALHEGKPQERRPTNKRKKEGKGLGQAEPRSAQPESPGRRQTHIRVGTNTEQKGKGRRDEREKQTRPARRRPTYKQGPTESSPTGDQCVQGMRTSPTTTTRTHETTRASGRHALVVNRHVPAAHYLIIIIFRGPGKSVLQSPLYTSCI